MLNLIIKKNLLQKQKNTLSGDLTALLISKRMYMIAKSENQNPLLFSGMS